MPFTLCHPAIVLPLHRYATTLTSLPALVIGSMAPDFVYFLSLGVPRNFTHTLPGAILYCVPAGLVVFLVYYALIRQPLLAWLPPAISSRMKRESRIPLQSVQAVCTVLGSLAIGALSHIFWDSFTHYETVFIHSGSPLRTIISLGSYDIPVYHMLQHLSSLVGFIVIAAYTLAWIKRTAPAAPYPAPLSTQSRLLALAAVAGAGLAGAVAGLLLRHAQSDGHALFNVIVTSMATAALAIVLLCIAWTVNGGKHARQR